MNKKRWLKKVSAILLSICMLAGMLQYVPFVSKAAPTDEVGAQLQAAGYTRVTPSAFGLDGTYTGLARGTGYGSSLHMTYLDMDVSFESVTNGNTHIRYAMDGSDNGIFICGYPSGNFMIKHTSNTAEYYAGTGKVQNVFSPTETGVDVKETFNLKLAVKFESATATSGTVTYSFWINDVLVAEDHTFTASGLGQNMGMFVLNSNNSITVSSPGKEEQEESDEEARILNEQLQAAGYTRVTPSNFGLKGTYTSLSRGTEYGSSLHMTYLDMDVSFEKVTNGNTHIRYAMDGSDRGIFICGYPSGNFMIKHTSNTVENYAGTGEIQNVYSPTETGVDVKKTFNLKLAVKYESAEATSGTVTYSFWINNQLVAEDHTFTADGLGRKMGMIIGNSGDSITVSSPVVKEPEQPEEEQPKILIEQLEEAGYTRVTPSDFELNGTYTDRGMARGEDLTESLDHSYLDMDVTFNKVTDGGTHIRFAMGAEDGGMNIIGYKNDGVLRFRDAFSNYTNENSLAYDMSLENTFNLKLALDYGTTDDSWTTVTYNVWVNNVLVIENGSMPVKNIGMGMGVNIGTIGDSITISDPKHTPEYYGYERVTMADFGLENGSYYPGVAPSDHYVGVYDGSLHNKYLDVDLSFSKNSGDACINYASGDGWAGLRIHGTANGLQIKGAWGEGSKEYTYEQMGLDASKGLQESFNLKLATEISNSYTNGSATVRDFTCTVWVNDVELERFVFTGMRSTGKQVAIYAKTGTVSIGATTEKTYVSKAFDLDEDGTYLVSGSAVKVWKDGVLQSAVTSGSVLDAVGNYTIQNIDYTVKSTQSIALYRLGDVNLDGTFNVSSDLAALKTLLEGKTEEYKATTAAEFAADLDNDNNVGTKDLELMQAILAGDKTLESVKAAYHVASVSYDYLGGDEVMPIFGFYGPYDNGTDDFITDEVFQIIKDSGINMITYTSRVINPLIGNTSVLQAMELAQKYGIGYYADDVRLNTEVKYTGKGVSSAEGAEPLDNETLADYLSAYTHFENYLGIDVADEPDSNQVPAGWYRKLDHFDSVCQSLNSFANQSGYLGALPNYYNSIYHDFDDRAQYKAYLTDIAVSTDAKMLSYNHYTFETRDEGVPVTRHFENMAIAREVAQENNIPFWSYVQAGGNFTANATVAVKQPNMAQTCWNVNTLLAFGAKGIGWFPTLQPDSMIPDESVAERYDRMGVVGQDGTKTDYFDIIQKANKQIAAVDEVLMKANSTGIIATTGKAATEVGGQISLITSTDMLDSVSTSNTTYGTLVGCFDYRETEAFYVVNYDVTAEQNITLNFKGTYDYRLVSDTMDTFETGSSATMTIPAGEAVLVVLEDRMVEVSDISEYRGATADQNKVPDAEPGYVFAGWYDEAGNPIPESTTSGKAYAKFVDASVMTVGAQIKADTTATSETTDIRFYTTVDSRKYKEVGFLITPEGLAQKRVPLNVVYEKLYYAGQGSTVEDTTLSPTDVSSQSNYFSVYSYWGVANKNFDKKFTVIPYWITLDGTTVYGDPVVKTISQGIAK